MAGPIGMAVLRGIKTVTCPHCGAKQARGRHVAGTLTCKVCRKAFTLVEAKPRPQTRPKPR